MNKTFSILLIVFTLSALAGLASASESFVILDSTNVQTMLSNVKYIEDNGGKITHRFPPNILIGDIPADNINSLKGKMNILDIKTDIIDDSTIKKFNKNTKVAANVWNNVFKQSNKVKVSVSKGKPKPLVNDARFIKDSDKKISIKPYSSAGKTPPYGAGFYDTSSYMLGDIAVGIIMPESNGAIDPDSENWTLDEESNVVSEIVKGLNYWSSENPIGRITFTYDIHYRVPTGYEPITNSASSNAYWIRDVMNNMGYNQLGFFDDIYDYNNRLRESMGTDWAYTAFVVNSLNDSDGMFSGGSSSAFAYVGGPYLVMTYDNDGYGIDNMNYVAAHETGHIFYATDEYNKITEYSGYLYAHDIENSGKIMSCAGCWGVSNGTALQLGWRDNNKNLISDLIDFSPYSAWVNIGTGSTPTIRGTSYATATFPHQNPYTGHDITINKIINVQYRVDNGVWHNAQPYDGLFDNAIEDFVFTTSTLSGGYHKVDVRSRNTAGVWENPYLSSTIYVSGSSSITVVTPNGGEKWKQGTSHLINWSSTGNPGNVKIELFKGGIVSRIISSNTSNSGSYNWAISSAQTPGADYKVKISSIKDSTISDTSNSNFNITASSDRLNSGESLGLGQYIVSQNGQIKLTLQGDGNLVLISGTQVLWASGTNGRGTLNAVMQSDGNFVIYGSSGAIWNSGTQGYPGAWLTVQNDGKAIIYDQTNMARWTVPSIRSSITVVSPNGGESWKHGTNHTISWSKTGNPGTNVKIELLKGAAVNRVITTSKSGISYSWAIPATQTPGTDYKIRITSISNSTYKDTSNNNFTIVT
jgi:hypothetical protein